jgi:hypothetical protein
MQWEIEDKRATKLKLLREWYKGNGEELYKQYTIYVVIYNKDTKTYSSKNINKYSYL